MALFTNEYLSRELSHQGPVEVRCFGEQDVQASDLRVKGYGPWPDAKLNTDPRFGGALDALYRSLAMAKDQLDGDRPADTGSLPVAIT